MSLWNSLSKLFRRPAAGHGSWPRALRCSRSLLRIDLLEDRCLPSTITPTTFDDGSLGSGSLRDAVLQFNADTGTGDDTIQLLAGTYALTIQNVGGRHETAGLTGDLNLTRASHHWIIQAAGSSGTNPTIIDARQLQDRVFEIVTPGTQVVFRNLIIQGGLAQDHGSDGALAVTTDALGGGIAIYGTHPVTLTNVTVTANRANTGGGSFHGGGIFVFSGSATLLHNTLMAGNLRGATGTTRDDVFGALDPGGDYNLIGDGTGMTGISAGVNGNQVGSARSPIDAVLGPLQDNGGPTLTHALLSGSPAIDAGNNRYATDWDQRGPGYPRIVNGIIDIGAFEYQGGGSGPSRATQRHVKPVQLEMASLASQENSPSQPLSSRPIPAVAPAQVGSPGQEVAVVDRLFASLNEEDARPASPVLMRHGRAEVDWWLPDADFAVWGLIPQ